MVCEAQTVHQVATQLLKVISSGLEECSGRNRLTHQSPTILAPRTGFIENNFSMDQEEGAWSMEKLFSMKPVLGAKMVGD